MKILGGKMAEGVEIGEREREELEKPVTKTSTFRFLFFHALKPFTPIFSSSHIRTLSKTNLKTSFRYVC
jgi:hypothetical protein